MWKMRRLERPGDSVSFENEGQGIGTLRSRRATRPSAARSRSARAIIWKSPRKPSSVWLRPRLPFRPISVVTPWIYAAPDASPAGASPPANEPWQCPPCPTCNARPDGPFVSDDSGAPAEDQETFVGRQGITAAIDWEEVKFDRFPITTKRRTGGVYVIVRDEKPIYVGQARDFAVRWKGRLLGLYQVGLLDPKPRPGGVVLDVWFGSIDLNTDAARRVVEHAIIRTFHHARIATISELRNQQSTLMFRVLGRIEITHLLPPPFFNALQKNWPSFDLKDKVPSLRQNNLVIQPLTVPTYELLGVVADS